MKLALNDFSDDELDIILTRRNPRNLSIPVFSIIEEKYLKIRFLLEMFNKLDCLIDITKQLAIETKNLNARRFLNSGSLK